MFKLWNSLNFAAFCAWAHSSVGVDKCAVHNPSKHTTYKNYQLYNYWIKYSMLLYKWIIHDYMKKLLLHMEQRFLLKYRGVGRKQLPIKCCHVHMSVPNISKEDSESLTAQHTGAWWQLPSGDATRNDHILHVSPEPKQKCFKPLSLSHSAPEMSCFPQQGSFPIWV